MLATLPQNCDDFLKRCYLEGKLYSNCSALFKPILTTHGFCCTFNNVYYFNGKRLVFELNHLNGLKSWFDWVPYSQIKNGSLWPTVFLTVRFPSSGCKSWTAHVFFSSGHIATSSMVIIYWPQTIFYLHLGKTVIAKVYSLSDFRNTVSNKLPNFTINAIGVFNALTVVTDYDPADAIEGTLLNGGAIRVSIQARW